MPQLSPPPEEQDVCLMPCTPDPAHRAATVAVRVPSARKSRAHPQRWTLTGLARGMLPSVGMTHDTSRIAPRVAFASYLLVVFGMLGTGLVYLFTPRFLSYHAAAYGQAWSEAPERLQLLYLTMVKAIGAPTLVAALAIGVILMLPWRHHERWALWAVPLLALGWGIPMLVIALYVQGATGAFTPWPALAFFDALICAAAALSMSTREARMTHAT